MRNADLLPWLLLLSACTAASTSGAPGEELGASPVRHWGGMRAVLREGQTQGRVELSEVIGPHTIAVGALEGLAAEITVVHGSAHLAEVLDADSADGLRVRPPQAGERASLLVLADVPSWSEQPLPAVADLAGLESSVRTLAEAIGVDVTRPFAFRVEGRASGLQLHVLDHSCPIAAPDGPPPWRFAGSRDAVTLVGFYAEGSAGELTHHGQSSHVHALLPNRGISGHLDAVRFEPGARLFLPDPGARGPRGL